MLSIFLTASNVTFAEPFIRWHLIIDDPDDDKFADLAISANARYLVTNDHHFNVLKDLPFPTVKVVSLTEFQQIMVKSTPLSIFHLKLKRTERGDTKIYN